MNKLAFNDFDRMKYKNGCSAVKSVIHIRFRLMFMALMQEQAIKKEYYTNVIARQDNIN